MNPEYDLKKLEAIAKIKEADNKAFFARLKKKKPKQLDEVIKEIHYDVFELIDCLKCANCCKTISPMIQNKDIERMSKALKRKPSCITEEYLKIDEDGDYVYKESPCPLLMPDNYCVIYENRPKACREYPHTDRRRFYQLLNLTLENTFVCPAVYMIIEKLKETNIVNV